LKDFGDGVGFATAARQQSTDENNKAVIEKALKRTFSPEFLNRIDDVVVFHPLGEEQLAHIIDLRLADLQKLLADRRITLELTPAARKLILKTGYDRAYGARPLKRAIQRMVQDPLAVKILDGSVRHGDHVVVDAGKSGLTFAVGAPEHAAV
jgi:ATP-dependent Clp protease ATP-binding subunit ClpB